MVRPDINELMRRPNKLSSGTLGSCGMCAWTLFWKFWMCDASTSRQAIVCAAGRVVSGMGSVVNSPADDFVVEKCALGLRDGASEGYCWELLVSISDS